MHRKLFTLAAGASAVLCVATAVLWVGSYWRDSVYSWAFRTSPTDLYERYVISVHGRVYVRASHLYNPAMGPMPYGARAPSFSTSAIHPSSFAGYAGEWDRNAGNRHFGVRWGRRVDVYRFSPTWTQIHNGFVLPYAYPFFLSAVPVALRLRTSMRSRRRRKLRLCLRCGYDLRASPDLCPECGTPVPGKTAA